MKEKTKQKKESENKKAGARTEKKLKGNQKIALERIYRLFELAEGDEEPSTHGAGDAKPDGFATYSKRYLQLAKRIGEKCRVSVPKELKERYCKKCFSLKVTQKKEEPFLVVTCKECGFIKKFGLKEKKK